MPNTLEPSDYTDGIAYLEAALPGREFGDSSQLLKRVPRDGPSQLVVLWNITDCAALDAGPAPQAEVRTWLGMTTRQSFDDYVRPGFDMPTLPRPGSPPDSSRAHAFVR